AQLQDRAPVCGGEPPEVAPGPSPHGEDDGRAGDPEPCNSQRSDAREEQDGEGRAQVVKDRADQEVGLRRKARSVGGGRAVPGEHDLTEAYVRGSAQPGTEGHARKFLSIEGQDAAEASFQQVDARWKEPGLAATAPERAPDCDLGAGPPGGDVRARDQGTDCSAGGDGSDRPLSSGARSGG